MMMKEKPADDSSQYELIELLKTVWNDRKRIVFITSCFLILGVVIAFLSPKEYEVSTVMIPQTKGSSKVGGKLGGLASLAGFDLDQGGGEEIPPTLYPRIVTSVPFQLEMMKTRLTVNGLEESVPYDVFVRDHVKGNPLSVVTKYTIGLPMVIYSAVRGGLSGTGEGEGEGETIESPGKQDSLIRLSTEEMALIGSLKQRISLTVDKRDGIIELGVTMPTAQSAAEMATHAQVLLQNAITDFKIKRATEEVLFTQKLYEEKKSSFERIEQELSEFEDRNQNIVSAVARMERNKLETKHELALSLYTQVAQQLENDKIQVMENTPSFAVLQPVVVPLNPMKPNKKLIVVGSILIGLFVSLGRIVALGFYRRIKSKW